MERTETRVSSGIRAEGSTGIWGIFGILSVGSTGSSGVLSDVSTGPGIAVLDGILSLGVS